MKTTLRTILGDRAYAVPFIFSVIVLLIILIISATHIRYSELQVPVRYTSFGITNFYREQWFYQLSFTAFAIMVFVIHTAISVRLYSKKGPDFSKYFAWFTVGVLTITALTVWAIFRVSDLP